MKRGSAILQRLTALLLLVVFLSVHVGKALHIHSSFSTVITKDTAAKQTIQAPGCAICDYHFVKDSDVDFTVAEMAVRPEPLLHVITYKSSHTASIGLSYGDRGPPALV